MFGGDDGGEIDIYYQWKGAYTKEQMSDEVLQGRELPRRQPQALPHRPGLLAATASRAGRARDVKFDDEGPRGRSPRSPKRSARTCRSRRAPTSASATRAARAAASRARRCRCMLVGDSTADAERARRRHRARCWHAARSCATCASTAATSNSELTVRVDRERAAAFGFSANEVAQLRRPGPARRAACASSAAAKPKCRCGCASPAPTTTASRTSPRFTVRAPDGRTRAAAGDGRRAACGRPLRRSSAPTARPR